MLNLPITRRELLQRSGMGFGALALQGMLTDTARADRTINPLTPKASPQSATAKHVVHLFMNGGPSQVDTFDPKPALAKYAGKALPVTLRTERRTGAALPSPFKFRKCG